jgi:hypothetical protein
MLLSVQAALAQEETLGYGVAPADMYEHININAHSVWFPDSTSATHRFTKSVSFYGQRYGDVGELLGSVVVYGPQTEKTNKLADMPDSQVVYSSTLFPLSEVPESPGWYEIPLSLMELPADGFRVAIYTRSNDERGVKIGLAPSADGSTHSSEFRILTKKEFEKDPTSGVIVRKDRREWLIRATVSYESGLGSSINSDSLSGQGFAYFDDGTAEGWGDFAENGAIVHFENDRKRNVDAVYVYAKLEGDWFGTDRNCSVILMNDRYNIVKRMSIPFSSFNEKEGWARLDLPNTEVPKSFFVLIQPRSEKNLKFLIGADHSGNRGSSVGTVGSPKDWYTDNPESDTNWMVRVHYTK